MQDSNARKTMTMCNGDVRAWIEQETIHVKVVDQTGDPVELNEAELRAFVNQLLKLAEAIRE